MSQPLKKNGEMECESIEARVPDSDKLSEAQHNALNVEEMIRQDSAKGAQDYTKGEQEKKDSTVKEDRDSAKKKEKKSKKEKKEKKEKKAKSPEKKKPLDKAKSPASEKMKGSNALGTPLWTMASVGQTDQSTTAGCMATGTLLGWSPPFGIIPGIAANSYGMAANPYAPSMTHQNPYAPTNTSVNANPYTPANTSVGANSYATANTSVSANPYVPANTSVSANPYPPANPSTSANPYAPANSSVSADPYAVPNMNMMNQNHLEGPYVNPHTCISKTANAYLQTVSSMSAPTGMTQNPLPQVGGADAPGNRSFLCKGPGFMCKSPISSVSELKGKFPTHEAKEKSPFRTGNNSPIRNAMGRFPAIDRSKLPFISRKKITTAPLTGKDGVGENKNNSVSENKSGLQDENKYVSKPVDIDQKTGDLEGIGNQKESKSSILEEKNSPTSSVVDSISMHSTPNPEEICSQIDDICFQIQTNTGVSLPIVSEMESMSNNSRDPPAAKRTNGLPQTDESDNHDAPGAAPFLGEIDTSNLMNNLMKTLDNGVFDDQGGNSISNAVGDSPGKIDLSMLGSLAGDLFGKAAGNLNWDAAWTNLNSPKKDGTAGVDASPKKPFAEMMRERVEFQQAASSPNGRPRNDLSISIPDSSNRKLKSAMNLGNYSSTETPTAAKNTDGEKVSMSSDADNENKHEGSGNSDDKEFTDGPKRKKIPKRRKVSMLLPKTVSSGSALSATASTGCAGENGEANQEEKKERSDESENHEKEKGDGYKKPFDKPAQMTDEGFRLSPEDEKRLKLEEFKLKMAARVNKPPPPLMASGLISSSPYSGWSPDLFGPPTGPDLFSEAPPPTGPDRPAYRRGSNGERPYLDSNLENSVSSRDRPVYRRTDLTEPVPKGDRPVWRMSLMEQNKEDRPAWRMELPESKADRPVWKIDDTNEDRPAWRIEDQHPLFGQDSLLVPTSSPSSLPLGQSLSRATSVASPAIPDAAVKSEVEHDGVAGLISSSIVDQEAVSSPMVDQSAVISAISSAVSSAVPGEKLVTPTGEASGNVLPPPSGGGRRRVASLVMAAKSRQKEAITSIREHQLQEGNQTTEPISDGIKKERSAIVNPFMGGIVNPFQAFGSRSPLKEQANADSPVRALKNGIISRELKEIEIGNGIISRIMSPIKDATTMEADLGNGIISRVIGEVDNGNGANSRSGETTSATPEAMPTEEAQTLLKAKRGDGKSGGETTKEGLSKERNYGSIVELLQKELEKESNTPKQEPVPKDGDDIVADDSGMTANPMTKYEGHDAEMADSLIPIDDNNPITKDDDERGPGKEGSSIQDALKNAVQAILKNSFGKNNLKDTVGDLANASGEDDSFESVSSEHGPNHVSAEDNSLENGSDAMLNAAIDLLNSDSLPAGDAMLNSAIDILNRSFSTNEILQEDGDATVKDVLQEGVNDNGPPKKVRRVANMNTSSGRGRGANMNLFTNLQAGPFGANPNGGYRSLSSPEARAKANKNGQKAASREWNPNGWK